MCLLALASLTAGKSFGAYWFLKFVCGVDALKNYLLFKRIKPFNAFLDSVSNTAKILYRQRTPLISLDNILNTGYREVRPAFLTQQSVERKWT